MKSESEIKGYVYLSPYKTDSAWQLLDTMPPGLWWRIEMDSVEIFDKERDEVLFSAPSMRECVEWLMKRMKDREGNGEEER